MKPRYLFPQDYMADPSANVFNGRLYVYPSHDWDAGECFDDDGGHFQMKDYHVLSFGDVEHDDATDHGVILDVKDVPWAEKQMWDNDVVEKDGRYYLIFSAKAYDGVFRLGVAVADKPEGPFVPQQQPIRGSFSIDPCAFKDDDGKVYVYFGGLWGGQLQWWRPLPNGQAPIFGKYGEMPTVADDKSENRKSENRKYIDLGAAPDHQGELYTTADSPAIPSCVVRMSDDVMQFAEAPRAVVILDSDGQPLRAGDPHRFFEASWMHKYQGKYYFSYSTGDSHLLCYAIGDSPYGPFRYQGVILDPVVGWTTHHSIVEYKGQWYLFYHDCVPSNDVTHLRSLKVQRLFYNDDGTIQKVINE
ncbi:MAG: glycoside hydrolase family 43 protein [Prevotella sp.]|nr:glycoside hydrolase family 43 protein [Prevotella sp.]